MLTKSNDQARTPEGQLRIGLAHGSVGGILAEDVDSPNHIAADRAMRAQLDYLALGDWHGKKQIDERTWYSAGTAAPTSRSGSRRRTTHRATPCWWRSHL